MWMVEWYLPGGRGKSAPMSEQQALKYMHDLAAVANAQTAMACGGRYWVRVLSAVYYQPSEAAGYYVQHHDPRTGRCPLRFVRATSASPGPWT